MLKGCLDHVNSFLEKNFNEFPLQWPCLSYRGIWSSLLSYPLSLLFVLSSTRLPHECFMPTELLALIEGSLTLPPALELCRYLSPFYFAYKMVQFSTWYSPEEFPDESIIYLMPCDSACILRSWIKTSRLLLVSAPCLYIISKQSWSSLYTRKWHNTYMSHMSSTAMYTICLSSSLYTNLIISLSKHGITSCMIGILCSY